MVSPIESKQVVKDEEIRREIPNNNPFKRRKLELATSEEGEGCAEIVSALMVNVEGSADVLCSSPESQVTVESKPPTELSVKKDKIQKKSASKNGHKSVKSEKNGMLKFFERL